MRSLHRVFIIVVLSLGLAGVAFVAGFVARGSWDTHSSPYPLVSEAHALLVGHFLGELPEPVALERGMIRGLLQTIGDPFTVFVEPAAHELEEDLLSGEYGGIGATLSRDEAGMVHLVPFDEGPAARAGVQEGDVLVAVDGKPVEPQDTLEEVSAALRGPAGTHVRLRLAARQVGEADLEITVVREVIPLPSVSSFVMPDDARIGVIAISAFSERTPTETEQAIQDLESRGVQALALDLRANPGGLFDAAVDVARLFLAGGVVASEQSSGQDEETYRLERAGPASETPLVVLVDAATASAAEVVAAAIQENRRAEVIGVPTFGKGSVQLVFELSDGSSLHVTTARWLTPNGTSLDGQGLQPDVFVDLQAPHTGDPYLAAVRAWFIGHGILSP